MTPRRCSLAARKITRSLLARRRRYFARGGRRQINSRAPRLRQADGDGLFGRASPVNSFADVIHLLLNKLTGLG
jgi:hypothetical protein